MALTKISTAMWNSVPHHDTHDFNVDDVLYVDVSANNVGIGTTNPSFKLQVNGDFAAEDNIYLTDAGVVRGRFELNTFDRDDLDIVAVSLGSNIKFFTEYTERMRIDSSGNVGIGKTPSYKLDVNSVSRFTDGFYLDQATAGTNASIYLGSNQTLELEAFGANGEIAFSVGSSISEAMRIDSSGNVGIGTTNPTNGKLQIDSNTNQISIETGTAGDGRLHIGHFTNGTFIGTYGDDGGVADIIRFGTHSGDERMRITSAGFVGINETNPSERLDINGAIKSTSNAANFQTESQLTLDYYDAIGAGRIAAYKSTGSILQFITNASGGNTTERMRINSAGNVIATVDMRAPIFYDSDDTNYYVDPTGNSKLKYIASGDAGVLASGYGITSYDSKRYLIGFRNSSATGTNYPWLVHDDISGGDGLIVHFNGVGDKMTLNELGSLTATGDMRTPIFYDSDNTGYYLNPASTSILSSLDIKFVQRWYRSGNNAHQRVDARLDGTDQARMHWYGKNDADSTVNFKHAWYDGGSYINVTAASDFVYFQETSGTVSVQADGSMRAPIFYDSDNTGYYLNPQSFSNLGSIKLNEVISSSDVGDARIGRNYAYNTLELKGYGAEMMIGAGNTALHINYRYCNNTANTSQTPQDWYWKAGTSTTYSNHYWGNGYGLSSLRAPIFYDHDNTTYYTDPSYISSMYGIAIRGDQGSSDSINQIFLYGPGDTTTSAIGFKYSAGEFTNPTGTGDGWNTYLSMDTAGRGWVFRRATGGSDFTSAYTAGWILNNGIAQFNSSTRSPIFYDSDNTGYYMDPASTSNLNTTSSDLFTAGQLRFKGVGGNSGQTAYDYAIYQAAGAWSYPYPDLIVGWHTGIRIGAYWNYGGIRFYNNSPESAGATEIFSVGNGDDHVRVANYLYAPVVYDTNNTGYYTDPASTSRTNRIISNLLDVTAGAAYAVRFWGGSDIYSIRMSEIGNSTYGGRVAGETTSDYNMYFTMAAGTNRGFVFRNANSSSSAVAGIDASGNGRFIGDVVAYSSSDERLKDNQKNIDNALEKVESLNGIEFDWNDKQDTFTGHDVGVIAQEVEKVLPEIVNTRDTGYKAVKYEKLVPLLIEAIKELSEKVKILENK